MAKKSNAQIRRMVKRAEVRGEEYVPPLTDTTKDDSMQAQQEGNPSIGADVRNRMALARRLRKELQAIDADKDMKSKERRSAKRKAEAVAAEKSGVAASELLEMLESQQSASSSETTEGNDMQKSTKTEIPQGKKSHNPYIVFIGQLSYITTRDALFRHIQRELGNAHTITDESIRIRLLTDSQTKKSRGMAFVETNDPELLYALLKMHHTQLDDRRINVERTTGGKRNSDARRSKLENLRKEQEQHMSDVVNKLLEDYLSSGELQEKELDDGVIALCKRHSAATVEASLTEYMETTGRDKDNPSAYLTHIIGRIADEGIEEQQRKREIRERRNAERKVGHTASRAPKRPRRQESTESRLGVLGRKLQESSELSKAGVDMTMSISKSPNDKLKSIFPSLSRGRGRGRGYM